MSGDGAAARRLHPATLISRSLQMIPRTVAAGAGYAAVIAQEGFGRILLFGGLAALVGVGVALLVWWRFRYSVGEREIVIESGVLHRQRRVIPFDRVQDIAIERPLLARLFGTARVRVETGGSAADEGTLDMIAVGDAQRLRDLIRRWNAAAPSTEAVGSAAEEAEPVLFEIGIGRLLYSGLFNFSLLFLAAIFAALQYLDDFGLVEPKEWITPEKADSATGIVTVKATLVLVAILLLLGLAAGVARTIARDFGYRLTRGEAGLRRRRGLFTLSEVVIPVRRTQVAVIDSGPVARALGWYRLSFQTLGADQKEGGVQMAAPFARMEELLPILAEAGFPPPPPRPGFARPPRRALIRWTIPYLLPALAALAAAFAWDARAGIAAGLLVAMAAYAVLRWRRHLYALDDRALFVSGGLLSRRLSIIPVARTQTVSLFRSPLQRRLRLATLLVDTAGAPLLRSPEIVDLEAEEAEALADRLLRRFLEARERLRHA